MDILIWRPNPYEDEKDGHLRNIRVPFNLKYTQAIFLNLGYKVILVDSLAEKTSNRSTLEKIKNLSPKVTIIDLPSYRLEYCLDLINEHLSLTTTIVVGHIATYIDRNAFRNINYILKGEVENESTRLVKHILSDKKSFDLPNIIHQVNDLDTLPILEFASTDELARYQHYYPFPTNNKIFWGHILTTRGCPHRCSFCTQNIRESIGNKIRRRKISHVLEEIQHQIKLGANTFYVADDDFTADRNHVIELCNELIMNDINIHWTAHARVDECDDVLLKLMYSAGCRFLRFGIESGSSKMVLKYKKTYKCDTWFSQTIQTIKLCRVNGIKTMGLFIIGGPDEDIEDLEKTEELIRKSSPDLIQLHFYTPYLGTADFEKLNPQLDVKTISQMYHYSISEHQWSKLSPPVISDRYKQIYKNFYLNLPFIIKHLRSFGIFYTVNPKTTFVLFRSFIRLLLKRNTFGLPNISSPKSEHKKSDSEHIC